MKMSKLSDAAALTTVNEIADGLKNFVKKNPDSAKAICEALGPALDELAEDDFFGTEGWEHAFGIE